MGTRRRIGEAQALEEARWAWRTLCPGEPEPERIEILARKKKSAACRLLGPPGTSFPVIAKRARRQTALLERAIHVEVLPQLPVRTLAWHGHIEADEAFDWILLEDAGESRFAPQNQAHRSLAAEWLAALHTASEKLDAVGRLPARGAREALAGLGTGRELVLQGASHVDARSRREVLRPLLEQYDVLESRWPQIQAVCDGMPRTLVHGDFASKNLRVRTGAGCPQLLVFDWEMAGVGIPASDLRLAELDRYASAVRPHWPHMDASRVGRLYEVGRLFRLLDEIRWAASGLLRPASRTQVVADLARHAAQLRCLVAGDGWAA